MRTERGRSGPLPYASLGTGRPVVVLAGLMPVAGVGSGAPVRTMLSGLARLSGQRRIVLFNRRRGLPEAMTMADFADEHAAALKDLFDGPVDVVGFSTGGSIAQQLAAEHPELVRRLVLVSSGCRLDGIAKSSQEAMGRHLREGRRDRAVAVMAGSAAPGWFGRTVVPTAARAVSSFVIPTEQDAADLAVTVEAEDTFDLAGCPPIAAPTLILAGGRDRYYPPALLRETAALIAGSRLQVLPHRGHVTVLTGRRGPDLVASFLDGAGRHD